MNKERQRSKGKRRKAQGRGVVGWDREQEGLKLDWSPLWAWHSAKALNVLFN